VIELAADVLPGLGVVEPGEQKQFRGTAGHEFDLPAAVQGARSVSLLER
jgi:hypothetical protein